jgi:hypothetical protein
LRRRALSPLPSSYTSFRVLMGDDVEDAGEVEEGVEDDDDVALDDEAKDEWGERQVEIDEREESPSPPSPPPRAASGGIPNRRR